MKVRAHPWPVRITHWLNATAVLVMVASGWRIYDNVPVFKWLTFPIWLTLAAIPTRPLGRAAMSASPTRCCGILPGCGCWWRTGFSTWATALPPAVLRHKLLPIAPREVLRDIDDALHLRLSHPDLSHYNGVQKLLYVGVILALCLIVLSGLAIWKPAQLHWLTALFREFPRRAVGAFSRHERDRDVRHRARDSGDGGAEDVAGDGDRRHRSPGAMSVRSPRGSWFRPIAGVDRTILVEERKLIADIDRRGFLRGSLSLGALVTLTGCDISNKDAVRNTLRRVSLWNDRVQMALFDPQRLAPTYTEAEVLKPPRFNAFLLHG